MRTRRRAAESPQLDLFGAAQDASPAPAVAPIAAVARGAQRAEQPGATLIDDGRRMVGTGQWFDPEDALARSERGAVLSDCGAYRYLLWRAWSKAPRALWIMLNPSTADASEDDPTIRRVCSFSRAWGAGGANVVNLFALRATDPKDLWRTEPEDRSGPECDAHIREAVMGSLSVVVVAWGVVPPGARDRAREVFELVHSAGRHPMCLGTTQGGHPKHPLYVPGATPLEIFGDVRV